MSITKSYNKHTNTYYAYETTYEWDDARQKKVQRKHCIGQFDPDTTFPIRSVLRLQALEYHPHWKCL